MTKQRSIGTILFAILFLFLSYSSAMSSFGKVLSYFPTIEESPTELIYRALIKRIELIEEAEIAGKDKLTKSGKQSEFNQKLSAFKNDAVSFRQKYIIQGNLLPYDQAIISIGFLTCILYLIAGVGLLIHFFWARKIVFGSVFLSLLLFLVILYQAYWFINYSQGIIVKFNTLYLLINPSEAPIFLPNQNIFKMVFLNSVFWIELFIVFLYFFAVCYYFTRPKVKERFQ